MAKTIWPKSQAIKGLWLKITCSSCPEQYDVFDGEAQVAYFRLRHGWFRVDVPDCGGKTIYSAQPEGVGGFTEQERQYYLTEAVDAVLSHLETNSEDVSDGETTHGCD